MCNVSIQDELWIQQKGGTSVSHCFHTLFCYCPSLDTNFEEQDVLFSRSFSFPCFSSDPLPAQFLVATVLLLHLGSVAEETGPSDTRIRSQLRRLLHHLFPFPSPFSQWYPKHIHTNRSLLSLSLSDVELATGLSCQQMTASGQRQKPCR